MRYSARPLLCHPLWSQSPATTMKKADFQFELPERLIARYPAPERRGSRLLVLDGQSGELRHQQFSDLSRHLRPDDLLVLNNTRVIPARVYGVKESGGKVEILVERILGPQHALAHIRASKSPRPGTRLQVFANAERVGDYCELELVGRVDELFELRLASGSMLAMLDSLGHVPLPPYIDRADDDADRERYQTVYAAVPGAVAAPTAGLHFDQAMLDELGAMGVNIATVTLHVGAGTFQPVRVEDIRQHRMHAEYVEVNEALCAAVRHCRERGGRVVAVGTTSVRCLESASDAEGIRPFAGDTDIFIYPGYRFRCVDALITNFHLPESTLLMLVSAFAGKAHIAYAYQQAIAHEYRFFSYGDAMFLTPQQPSLQRARSEAG